MSDDSLKRLEQAVVMMEKAAKARAAVAAPADSDELAATRLRNTALSKANETVSAHLDGAISRLKAILES